MNTIIMSFKQPKLLNAEKYNCAIIFILAGRERVERSSKVLETSRLTTTPTSYKALPLRAGRRHKGGLLNQYLGFICLVRNR